MTLEQLRTMHQARPFRPFDIHLADGRVLSVDHPELLAIIPPGRTIIVTRAETFEIVDLLLVTSLEQRNGSPRRRQRRR